MLEPHLLDTRLDNCCWSQPGRLELPKELPRSPPPSLPLPPWRGALCKELVRERVARKLRDETPHMPLTCTCNCDFAIKVLFRKNIGRKLMLLRAVTRMFHESPARAPHPKEKVIRALRKVSQSPLVFIFDEFVDKNLLESLQHRPTIGFGKADMIQLLIDISPAAAEPNPAQREFMELISSELFNGQWGANDALRVNCTKSTDPQNNSSASTASSYPEGLHVDTNNHAIFRSVTCILYLNDLAPECGGATIFPLAQSAETDAMLCASRSLLRQRCMHTRTRQPVTMPEADAGVEARLQGVEARLQARLRSRDAACDAGAEEVRLPSDVVTDVEARHLQVTQPSLLLEGHMNDSALRIQVQSPLPPAPLSCAPVSPLTSL